MGEEPAYAAQVRQLLQMALAVRSAWRISCGFQGFPKAAIKSVVWFSGLRKVVIF